MIYDEYIDTPFVSRGLAMRNDSIIPGMIEFNSSRWLLYFSRLFF